MTNPIEKIKKIKGRGWPELRTRGEQLFSAYTEKIGLSGKLPSDAELLDLIDKSHFGGHTPLAENLFRKFYEVSRLNFFRSMNDPEKTAKVFRERFGGKPFQSVIERADKICQNRFDLLGYKDLKFGSSFDWHFEPVSGKHIPLRHWKRYDELDASETGDKKVVWELNRHQHFFTLGVAYSLTGDEVFPEAFVYQMESWMAQNPPGLGINWMSSLEVSFRAMSWIWALNLFRGSQRITLKLFIEMLKFLHVHGRHIEKYLSTYYSPNTHLTGEALGLYYLGTQLPFFKRAAHWRKKGREILIGELGRQLMDDGVYFEQSTWYQRYTVDFYTQFLLLARINREDLGAELEDRLQKALDNMMYVTRPDGRTPLIGDDDGGRALPVGSGDPTDFRHVLAVGAAMFGRPDYKFVAGGATEELLWLTGPDGLSSFDKLQADRPKSRSISFPDGGYFAMRDGWEDTDGFMLIDCGNMGGLSAGHSHADTLSFELTVAGRPMLVDPGTFSYHDSDKLRNYFRSTIAHNTLDIDRQPSSELGGKFGWRTTANAELLDWISDGRFDFFEGRHDGYAKSKPDPATHTRAILGIKNDYWIMRDHVETLGEREYRLNFHFDVETAPVITRDGETIEYVDEAKAGEVGFRLAVFGDNGEWDKKESWVSKCYGEKINAPYIRYKSHGIGPQEFFSFMFPVDPLFEKPEVKEVAAAGGRVFQIDYRGYRDIFVFSDGIGQVVTTGLFQTDFRFTWARLSKADGKPEEFIAVGGSTLVYGETALFEAGSTIRHAAVRRFGNDLNIRTDNDIFTVSLA